MNCLLKLTILVGLVARVRTENDTDLCNSIFLFAAGSIGKHQSALMGKYSYSETHNGRPYYSRMFGNKTYYFFYNSEETQNQAGWILGSELGGNTLNVVARKHDDSNKSKTRHFNDFSPVGIHGAYDRNETFDASFNIECVDDSEEERGPKCCSVVTVIATGDILKYQIVRLGTYTRAGVFNGHALYHLFQYNHTSYLYFRKNGRNIDGWTIGTEAGQDTFSITTRNRTHCPNQVTHGYDRDRNHDPSFMILCDTDDGEVDDLPLSSDPTEVDLIDDNGLEIGEREMSQARESSSTSLTATTTIFAMSFLLSWIMS